MLRDLGIESGGATDALKSPTLLTVKTRLLAEFGESFFAGPDQKSGLILVGLGLANIGRESLDLGLDRVEVSRQLRALRHCHPFACRPLLRELRRIPGRLNLSSFSGRRRAAGPCLIKLAPMGFLAPIDLKLFALALLARECVHVFKDLPSFFFQLVGTSAHLVEPIFGILELSAWPPRAQNFFKRVVYRRRNPPAPLAACDNANLRLDATLQGAAAGIVELGIAKRTTLTDPERSPNARLAAAPAARKFKQSLKL